MSDKRRIYIGDTKASSAEQEWLMSAPAVEIKSAAEMLDLARSAQEAYRIFSGWIRPRMDAARAARVRQMRCVENKSYRAIAGESYIEWGADANWFPLTNQIAGMALCAAAADLLGENPQRHPWIGNEA